MSDVIINPKLTASDVLELRNRAAKLDGRPCSNGSNVIQDICGVSQVSVNNWVNGKRKPKDIHTAKMIGELGAPSRFDGDSMTYIHNGDEATLAFTIIGNADDVVAEFETIKSQVSP